MAKLTTKHEPCGHFTKHSYNSIGSADLERLEKSLSITTYKGGSAISAIPCIRCRREASPAAYCSDCGWKTDTNPACDRCQAMGDRFIR